MASPQQVTFHSPPTVKNAQKTRGSRDASAGMEEKGAWSIADFIAERDSFASPPRTPADRLTSDTGVGPRDFLGPRRQTPCHRRFCRDQAIYLPRPFVRQSERVHSFEVHIDELLVAEILELVLWYLR